ncbi:MAG TPA: NAD(P)H-dependent oxidoreductase subunit E [Lentisphaeria bacterium]|nr:MAG: NAD(P)-dependent iron-only hydrogenase diaphorase iron-sulfur protein [Lentisphaerae bacterium GWF2_49_21]HBC86244.1 NAD(P)H-dependent oxidoreductase subunit E [Lentisphaeria bacterium]
MNDGQEICSGATSILESLPEKRKELEDYMDGLPLGNDPEKNRGFLIESLHKAQGIFGYLPEEVQLLVARKLKLHLSEVFGVISFYSYFTIVPKGRYKINVCTGTACFVKGADGIVGEFKRFLNIEMGETTSDMKFSLGGLRCVGACSLAPVVLVNDKVYGNVTPKQVPDILVECK